MNSNLQFTKKKKVIVMMAKYVDNFLTTTVRYEHVPVKCEIKYDKFILILLGYWLRTRFRTMLEAVGYLVEKTVW